MASRIVQKWNLVPLDDSKKFRLLVERLKSVSEEREVEEQILEEADIPDEFLVSVLKLLSTLSMILMLSCHLDSSKL